LDLIFESFTGIGENTRASPVSHIIPSRKGPLRTTQDHTGPDKTRQDRGRARQDRGRMDNMQKEQVENTLREILPKTGLVYSERGALSEILCKPKIMPLKSAVLEKIQKIEGEVEEEEEKAQQGFVQFTR
jgi:BBSome-interacting protein 1